MIRDAFNHNLRPLASDFGSFVKAAEMNDAGAVSDFLDQWDDGSDDMAKEKTRALQTASVHGAVEAAMALIDRGTNVNAKSDGGWSPLRVAAQHRRTQMAVRLLDRGADIDMQDNMGWTALMLAANNGNEELAALLLRRGAGLDQQHYHMEKTAQEIAEAKAAEGDDAQLNAARLRIAALIHQEQSARAAQPFTRGTDQAVAVRQPVRFRK